MSPPSSQPSLSFSAILVIAANTMNGPGLATLPSIASSAGVVTFQILVVVAAAVTCFVLVRLIKVQWAVAASSSQVKNGAPSADAGDVELEVLLQGNHTGGTSPSKHKASSTTFSRPQLEDTDIVALSDRIFDQKKMAAWAMVGCALSLALAQMMLTAAIADAMIVVSMGGSCGVSFFGMDCTSLISMKPFSASANTSILSAGIVLASSITISLASVDLDSLLTAQYVLFGCLLLASARFCLTLQSMDSTSMVDIMKPRPITDLAEPILAPVWIGDRPFDAVGPILFNFAFVVTAPPLICGTSSPFRAMQPLVVASLLMGVLYIVVGTIGANAATGTEDDNLLSLVLQGKDPATLQFGDVLAVMLFGLSQLAAIPVYCELARGTLSTHLNVSNPRKAFFASHVGPWVVVALTYNSALFQAFVEWSSLLLLGFANFSMPLLLDHTHSQRALLAERGKLHIRHDTNCPGGVAWGLALITASIAAVIVQRLLESFILAELVFLFTTLVFFHLS